MTEQKVIKPKSVGGGRSVAFPFITLEAAINRSREFWDKEGKNKAPFTAVAAHWNYGLKSSGLRQTISALKQYGLMEDFGVGDDRLFKLTDRALDIIIEPEDSLRRKSSIRDAALAPKIYSELLSLWQADSLPSEPTMHAYLLREKDFNRNAVKDFISGFKANIAFANLASSAIMSSNELVAEDEESVMDAQMHKGVVAGQNHAYLGAPVVKPAVGCNQDTWTLKEGKVVLQWPTELSADSFEDFEGWIQLQLKKIKRDSVV